MTRRFAHEFHALWYGLGPYGPQDIHVHPCSKDGHGPNDEGPKAGCSEVLLGYDRDRCTGSIEDHERANLEDKASVERAAARLRPAKPAEPAYCFCARVFPDCEPATSEMQDQNSLWVPLCERCMQIAWEAGVRVRKLQQQKISDGLFVASPGAPVADESADLQEDRGQDFE